MNNESPWRPFWYAVGVAAAIIGLIVLATPVRASPLEDIVGATYKLHSKDNAYCSAVAISDKMLLSAAHCFQKDNMNVREIVEDDKFEVEKETVFHLKALRTLTSKDVMLLEVKGDHKLSAKGVDIATVAEADTLKLGDQVTVLGFPKVKELTLTRGEYTGKVKSPVKEWDSPLLRTTVPVTGGNSGGGLYAEFDGEYKLVGLTSAGYRDVSFMNYFSVANSIEEVTKGLFNKEEKEPEETKIPDLPLDIPEGGLKEPETKIDLK